MLSKQLTAWFDSASSTLTKTKKPRQEVEATRNATVSSQVNRELRCDGRLIQKNRNLWIGNGLVARKKRMAADSPKETFRPISVVDFQIRMRRRVNSEESKMVGFLKKGGGKRLRRFWLDTGGKVEN